MTTANVFNISRCCVDDGSGIRTTVFLKGCPLHCLRTLRDRIFYQNSGGSYMLADIKEPDADTKKRWQAMMDEGIRKR